MTLAANQSTINNLVMRFAVKKVIMALFLCIALIALALAAVFTKVKDVRNEPDFSSPYSIVEYVRNSSLAFSNSDINQVKDSWRVDSEFGKEIIFNQITSNGSVANDDFNLRVFMYTHFNGSAFNTSAGGLNWKDGYINDEGTIVCIYKTAQYRTPADEENIKIVLNFGCGNL